MKRLIVWDFNGTIIDDTATCLSIENKMLKDRGEDYRNLFCFPIINYYKKLGYTFENESYQEISNEFHRDYAALFNDIPLMDGFLDKIHESMDKGYDNVIFSATEQNLLNKQVKDLGINQYFKALIGIDDNMAFSKIEHAKRWIEENNINPNECFYIGDTLHDLETIKALKIKEYALVACGHQSFEVLEKEDHDHVVPTLKEVNL